MGISYLALAAVLASALTPAGAQQQMFGVASDACTLHPPSSLQCRLDNGSVSGTPCDTQDGVFCCVSLRNRASQAPLIVRSQPSESDCVYPDMSSSASSAASKPTSSSSMNGSSMTVPHPSQATSAMPKFSNEAIAGSGIATAAIWGILGAGLAFI